MVGTRPYMLPLAVCRSWSPPPGSHHNMSSVQRPVQELATREGHSGVQPSQLFIRCLIIADTETMDNVCIMGA